MIKPSDKVLIGWLTLLATFASTNLGRASAREMSTEQTGNDSITDLATTEQPDVAEAVDAAVAANAESITPENGAQHPEFSPQAVVEDSLSEDGESYQDSLPTGNALPEQTVLSNSQTAKLKHLAATATQPLPDGDAVARSQALEHLAATVVQKHPSTDSLTNKLSDIPSEATSAVTDTTTAQSEPLPTQAPLVASPTITIPVNRPATESIVTSEPFPERTPSSIQENEDTDAAGHLLQPLSPTQADEIPTAALPTTRVISPTSAVPPSAEHRLSSVDSADEVSATSIENRPLSVRVSEAIERSRALTASASNAVSTVSASASLPEEAVPVSIVLRPNAPSSNAGLSPSAGSETSETDAVDAAQLPLEPPILTPNSTEQDAIDELLLELDQADPATPYRSSPAITISNPSGFGADNLIAFVGVGYQERTRFGNQDDGGMVVGVGLGDARKNVGVQLSYTVASFGGSRDFGTGGFNAKLHRRLADEWSVALGWEGFATTGFVDFEDSIYGSVSHLIRTQDDITKPFSRIALTAGVGSGRFRTEEAVIDDRDEIGVFGSVAVRVVEPVSAIVEWTGQDLAAGVSVTPFKDLPIVLLPAVRDITGAGDGARFVMGAGVSFQL